MSFAPFLRILASLSLLALLALSACDDPQVQDTGTFELNFAIRAGGAPFVPGTVLSNIQKQRFSVDTLRLYITDLRLVRTDGTEEKLSDAELFDFVAEYNGKTTHGAGAYRQYQVAPGAYKGIRFGVGVAPTQNHSSPSQYSATHPLGSGSKMYLSTSDGYAFMKLTGTIDTTAAQNGPVTTPISYYTALDSLYRTFDYTLDKHNFAIESNTELVFGFELDINRLFYNSADTINMAMQRATTSRPLGSADYQLSKVITQNFGSNAIYKIPF